MCKKTNYKIPNPKIDKCMKQFIHFLANRMPYHLRIRACCCGHGKYPMTIIYENISQENMFREMISQKRISRKRNFYKRDKEGYYYIPETIEGKK